MYRLVFNSRISSSEPASGSGDLLPSSYWHFSCALEDYPEDTLARAVILLHKNPSALYSIRVDPAHRKFGIGDKLLSHILATIDGDGSIPALDTAVRLTRQDGPEPEIIVAWLTRRGFVPQMTVNGFMTMRRYGHDIS